MRKAIVFGTAALLLLLGTQAVVAYYGANGALTVSDTTPLSGGSLTVAGDGFMPDSDVEITIEPSGKVLGTATADETGAFELVVDLPADVVGNATIVATGVDPQESVRVLATDVNIIQGNEPPTNASIETASVAPSPIVTGIAAAGVLLVSTLALLALRKRGANAA